MPLPTLTRSLNCSIALKQSGPCVTLISRLLTPPSSPQLRILKSNQSSTLNNLIVVGDLRKLLGLEGDDLVREALFVRRGRARAQDEQQAELQFNPTCSDARALKSISLSQSIDRSILRAQQSIAMNNLQQR